MPDDYPVLAEAYDYLMSSDCTDEAGVLQKDKVALYKELTDTAGLQLSLEWFRRLLAMGCIHWVPVGGTTYYRLHERPTWQAHQASLRKILAR